MRTFTRLLMVLALAGVLAPVAANAAVTSQQNQPTIQTQVNPSAPLGRAAHAQQIKSILNDGYFG